MNRSTLRERLEQDETAFNVFGLLYQSCIQFPIFGEKTAAELTERTGFSETMVRRKLKMLVAEGLVEAKRGPIRHGPDDWDDARAIPQTIYYHIQSHVKNSPQYEWLRELFGR